VRPSRCELRDPHQLSQKRSLALASILQGLAAAKNRQCATFSRFWSLAIFEFFNTIGTNRTNRAGLLMSVDRGRPEVAGRRSKRRFDPMYGPAVLARGFREKARGLSAGDERDELLRKVQQDEIALRLIEWVTSPGQLPPPEDLVPIRTHRLRRK